MGIENDSTIVVMIILCVFIATCGCINQITDLFPAPQGQPIVIGHVFLDGKAVKGAAVEAISANGTYHRYAVTGDDGAYAFNITPETNYNITVTYKGLQHTIWPVYLPGDNSTFNIYLTKMSTSTIEGTGYTIISVSPFESKEGRYKIYNHTRWSGFLINAKSIKDNTTSTAITDVNGSYIINVEPNTTYVMKGYFAAPDGPPNAIFEYRNGGESSIYASDNLSGPLVNVSSNETVLVDYIFPMP